jgi:hypothetical protein
VAEAFDRATLARETIAEQGFYFTDRWGAPRKHPAVSVLEASTIAFARLVRELSIGDSEPPARVVFPHYEATGGTDMPRKTRRNKRRDALTADAIAFLEGRNSFTQFKDHEELVALWLAHGDEKIAEWDMQENTRPRPVAE